MKVKKRMILTRNETKIQKFFIYIGEKNQILFRSSYRLIG
jgi:hypothetical protein